MLKEYQVYRRRWEGAHLVDPDQPAWCVMIPTITITARSPEDALRIAKQKGHLTPIIGEVK